MSTKLYPVINLPRGVRRHLRRELKAWLRRLGSSQSSLRAAMQDRRWFRATLTVTHDGWHEVAIIAADPHRKIGRTWVWKAPRRSLGGALASLRRYARETPLP